jgi:putative flavoprotein involved in K+ transport
MGVPTNEVPRDTSAQREVVVVGGGQAGLAVGHFLAEQGRRFTILEAAGEPAAAWRARWDSLKLFTPVRYDSLPGLAFPGDPDSYPGRDDVVAYLTDYARRFELPVEFNSRVQSVRARDGAFLVELADRTYDADKVVVATGPFQVPFTPRVADGLSGDLVQTPSSDYRSPAGLPAGAVLVVGGGNTGFQMRPSWPSPVRCILRLERARRRFRSASSAGTCSATSKPPA